MSSLDLGLAEQTKLKLRIGHFVWWLTILGMVADHLLCGIVNQPIGSHYTKSWPPSMLRTLKKVCGGWIRQ